MHSRSAGTWRLAPDGAQSPAHRPVPASAYQTSRVRIGIDDVLRYSPVSPLLQIGHDGSSGVTIHCSARLGGCVKTSTLALPARVQPAHSATRTVSPVAA